MAQERIEIMFKVVHKTHSSLNAKSLLSCEQRNDKREIWMYCPDENNKRNFGTGGIPITYPILFISRPEFRNYIDGKDTSGNQIEGKKKSYT